MKKTAVIILADGFEEVEAITPIDLLRRAEIAVTVVGLDSLEVRGSHDIYVKAETTLVDFNMQCDALILPGGPGAKNLKASGKVIETVRRYFLANRLCAAICAAPTVFGHAGILQGKNATCFPGCEAELGGAIFHEERSVTDGNIITSRGAGTAVEFSLAIIGYLRGEQLRREIAARIVYT